MLYYVAHVYWCADGCLQFDVMAVLPLQVSALAFSPDGKIMATGSGGEGAVDVRMS